MSSGTQVDLDWAGTDSPSTGGGNGAAGALPTDGADSGGTGAGVRDAKYLTDEEILGMEPVGVISANRRDAISGEERNRSSISDGDYAGAQRDSSGRDSPQNDNAQASAAGQSVAMPAWLATLAGDPKVGAEAQALWSEHQAFRAAFSSADEARAIAADTRSIKELLPGGAQEVLALRQMAQEVDSLRVVAREAETLRQNAASLQEAAQSVDRIDAAIFSGDVRAQSEVAAELARMNPAAFRSMFAEAAKVLAGMGETLQTGQGGRAQSGGVQSHSGKTLRDQSGGPTLRNSGEGWGTHPPSPRDGFGGPRPSMDHAVGVTEHGSRATDHVAPHQSPATSHQSPRLSPSASPSQSATFDPAAYASFERSTNDVVARDVRGSIGDTLTRVMPEGVAEGAAKRIGDDIFQEIHRALAADRTLSEQVSEVLRDRRFGMAEQQRVASLIAGRAKQLVPSVARRVIGEWTSSVLGTARSKAARQAAASSRIDIAAPGGSLDSMPLRAMSSREINYASMSDDEILGM